VSEGPAVSGGTFISRKVQAIPSSGIRRFFELIASMDGVVSLGVGEPDFVTPEAFSQAAFRAVADGHTHYTSNYGLLELREALAEHLERLYGVRYDPESEIIITVGVSEGLLLATHALLDPGDEMLCPDPYYVAYLPVCVLAGATFVPVPTHFEDDFRLRPEELEARITPRSKALLLGYPANPTGAQMSREELYAIAQVAERHDLIIISDEIYDRLVYEMPHTCFASLPGMKERTVLLGGFSKAYALTGWRVGWACAPAPILEAMMKVHQYVIMSAPTPSQYAALAALREGEVECQRMVADFAERRRFVARALQEMGLPFSPPMGAFYVFPSVRHTGMDDVQFAEALLREEKVAVIPGSAFGEGGRGHVRICYAAPWPHLQEAMERMARFLRRL
jgi:aminotransferase